MADPAGIERTLLAGAEKARALSRPFMGRLRQAVGLRNLAEGAATKTVKGAKASKGSSKIGFKQYRERDGLFYFKLLDERGSTLLQSIGFKSPQDAGQIIGALQQSPDDFVNSFANQLEPIDNETALAAAKVLKTLSQAAAES